MTDERERLLVVFLSAFAIGALATLAFAQTSLMSFTMPDSVTDGGSCGGATPMLADSCTAHFMWRGPITSTYYPPFSAATKIKGRKGQRYSFPKPTRPGTYELYYYVSGVLTSPCLKKMIVVVSPPFGGAPNINDLKITPR